jgi:hypothetical protein
MGDALFALGVDVAYESPPSSTVTGQSSELIEVGGGAEASTPY